MTREQLAPGPVAQLTGDDRGVHEVGEEQRSEDPTVQPSSRAEKGAESRPFQQHTWFVAYGVAVVIRRDVVDIVRPEVEYRAVLELRAEPTREHHPDVVRLTPVSPDNGPRVGGPSPARFLDRATDRQVAQVNQILGDPGEPDCVIRCPQVWNGPPYRPMVNGCTEGQLVKPPGQVVATPSSRATSRISQVVRCGSSSRSHRATARY